MDEADYYDEFGNYIGPESETNGTEINEELYDEDGFDEDNNMMQVEPAVRYSTSTTVVLQEDKKYFPSAMEVYGESVQVLVEEEDAQPLTEPIIAPIKEILVDSVSSIPVKMKYSIE